MTSSYTSMLLAGLLFSRFEEMDSMKSQVESLVSYGTRLIRESSESIKEIAELNFKRAVFLGSGPLYGTSTESLSYLYNSKGAVKVILFRMSMVLICKKNKYLFNQYLLYNPITYQFDEIYLT